MKALHKLLIVISLCWFSNEAFGQDYRYSPYEKPDPFDPSLLARNQSEAIHPLQSTPIQEMTLVGTIIGRSAAALILAPDFKSEVRNYIVKVGDKLGSNSGSLIAILSDRIIVREPLETPKSDKFSRFKDTAILLKTRENQTPTELISDVSLNSQTNKKSITQAMTQDLLPEQSDRANPYSKGLKRKLELYGSSPDPSISITKDSPQFRQNRENQRRSADLEFWQTQTPSNVIQTQPTQQGITPYALPPTNQRLNSNPGSGQGGQTETLEKPQDGGSAFRIETRSTITNPP